MKGWNWTGEEHAWTRKPEHYGAIHFHSDDLYDAGWTTSVSVTLPKDLPSGPYALHVRCGESDVHATREDYISFFVTPPKDAARRGSDRSYASSRRLAPILLMPITPSTSPRAASKSS